MNNNIRRINIRRRLWDQAEGRCHYCGQFTCEAERSLDHVIPCAFGGPTSVWNLVAACKNCNHALAQAALKCRCSHCTKALNRFHQTRKQATVDGTTYMWERRNRSEDEVIARIQKHMGRIHRRINALERHDTMDAAALRGTLNGLRIALETIGKPRLTS